MDAGLNVARINFSHSTHEQHAATIALVRQIAKEMDRPIAILGDLQGPRIRIGQLPATRALADGADVVFAPEGTERGDEVPVTYANLAEDVHVGDRILINDGLIELVVLAVDKPRVTARVLHGGDLTSHKGINLPGVKVSAPSITDKDRDDVAFAVQAGTRIRRPELRAPRAGHRRAANVDPQVDARRGQDREGFGIREH